VLAHGDLVHELACGHMPLCGLPPIQTLQTRVRALPPLFGRSNLLTTFWTPSVEEHDLSPPSPDWRRFTILLFWYLAGFPVAYVMRGTCSAEAPGTWGRALRVFIEGVVAFGLAGCIYGLGRCLLPAQPRSRVMILPFLPEKKSPAPPGNEPHCATVESV
jgi:hypothetical protein